MTTDSERRMSAERPSRTLSIARPRLVDLLAESDGPLTFVSAPAGSGKSVLLRQWSDSDTRTHVAIRLQPWSNSPAALTELLIAGLDPLGTDLDEVRTVATGDEPRFSATLLPALAAAAASRDAPYVLIVDDCHLLTDDRCQRILEVVADAIPAASRLVLASRTAAPPWLARARTNGDLVEVSSSDLAFRPDEAAEILALHGVPTDPELVDRVLAVTEGWPVGVYLVALLLSGVGSTPDAVSRLSASIGRGRPIREYLHSQVLDRLDADARAFLRQTSILDVVVPALSDRMLGRHDSLSVLRRLARSVQLVVSLDDTDDTFRYHHLLQDVLRDELTEVEPETVSGLHASAAQWYGENDELDLSVRHAVLSGDVPFAATVITHNLGKVIGVGTPDRLAEWLRPLDDRVLAGDPLLAVSRCWLAIQRGDDADVAVWLRRAEALCPRWPERVGEVDAAGAVAVTALIAGTVPLARAGRIADRMAEALPPELPYVSTAHVLGFMAEDLVGIDAGARDRHAEAAIAVSTAFPLPSVTANALSWQALGLILDGNLADARPLQERANEIVGEARLDRLATSGVTMSVNALYLALSNRVPEAEEALGAARRQFLRMRGILRWFRTVGPLLHAATMARLGDPGAARRVLSETPGLSTGELATSRRVRQLVTLVEASIGANSTLAAPGRATLTDAELRVMQYLPSHLSLPQVAERLFLSTNTVKTHVQAIYRKLGVTSRDEAVVAARALGLIESVPDLGASQPVHLVRVDHPRPPALRRPR